MNCGVNELKAGHARRVVCDEVLNSTADSEATRDFYSMVEVEIVRFRGNRTYGGLYRALDSEMKRQV
jgi:hypothetical protein